VVREVEREIATVTAEQVAGAVSPGALGVGRAERCEVRQINPDKVEHVRALLLEDDEYMALAETFRALGDSSRAKILYSLLHQELCVCDLAAVVGISESAVSQHLRILRSLRLVKSRREGKVVFYSLDDGHIRTLLNVCLSHVRHAASGTESKEHVGE
jgi:DNA-binding transcriptional ArsR family regulator